MIKTTLYFLIIQTIKTIKSNSLCLKYQRFTPSGCKDLGITIFDFATLTQFLNISAVTEKLTYSYRGESKYRIRLKFVDDS